METSQIYHWLCKLGDMLQLDEDVEIVLVGGAAGMLSGQLSPDRITMDCDVIRCIPWNLYPSVEKAAQQLAQEEDLPINWLNDDVAELDVLPDGWQSRKVEISRRGRLIFSSISRKDLIAMKFFAGHPRDVEDIAAMAPDPDELAFARTYLNMLRVPSRRANLDQVESGLKLLRAFEESADDGS